MGAVVIFVALGTETIFGDVVKLKFILKQNENQKPLNCFDHVVIFPIATTDELLMIFKGQMLHVRLVIIFLLLH